MKQSIVILALLGKINAISIRSGFIEGDFTEDNDFAQKQAEKAAKSTESTNVATKTDVHTDVNSDPIFPSTGPPSPPDVNTEEAVLERDLASRKAIRYTLDPDEHPETQDSLKWAENLLGEKLKPPFKTAFELEMEKLGDEHKFTYESEDDQDVVSTLASAKQAEGAYYGQRYGWGHGHGYDWDKGGHYGGHGGNSWWRDQPQQDWWNHLVKDNGYEGMVSASNMASKRFHYNEHAGHNAAGWKDYDKLAEEFWRERARTFAKQQKGKKQTKADKEAADELSKAGAKSTEADVPKAEAPKKAAKADEGAEDDGGEGGDGGAGGDAKKEEGKGDAKGDAKADDGAAKDDAGAGGADANATPNPMALIPELDPSQAAAQVKSVKKETEVKKETKKTVKKKAAKKQEQKEEDEDEPTINIGGEKIILGNMSSEDGLDDELKSQDLTQMGEEGIDEFVAGEPESQFIQTKLHLSNQAKLERLQRAEI